MREELQLSQVAAIKKFYETNEIELKWKKIKSYIGKGGIKRIRKDSGYRHLEIAKMVEAADQRGKVLYF